MRKRTKKTIKKTISKRRPVKKISILVLEEHGRKRLPAAKTKKSVSKNELYKYQLQKGKTKFKGKRVKYYKRIRTFQYKKQSIRFEKDILPKTLYKKYEDRLIYSKPIAETRMETFYVDCPYEFFIHYPENMAINNHDLKQFLHHLLKRFYSPSVQFYRIEGEGTVINPAADQSSYFVVGGAMYHSPVTAQKSFIYALDDKAADIEGSMKNGMFLTSIKLSVWKVREVIDRQEYRPIYANRVV